jgi:hypothetical protein
MIINYTNINKTNNHLLPKESSNSDGHQLQGNQQSEQSPLPKESINSHGHQLH